MISGKANRQRSSDSRDFRFSWNSRRWNSAWALSSDPKSGTWGARTVAITFPFTFRTKHRIIPGRTTKFHHPPAQTPPRQSLATFSLLLGLIVLSRHTLLVSPACSVAHG